MASTNPQVPERMKCAGRALSPRDLRHTTPRSALASVPEGEVCPGLPQDPASPLSPNYMLASLALGLADGRVQDLSASIIL